ncbi:acyl-CoA dehydrogenase family protein [Oceanicella sp. SM1341]|uniref:acyl-CoA dehydrogenase family protein n=1 Tax=Oceanicella sp. SM1341 TaxID=1548889 RepID=UPI000E49F9DB|nr:acyl-CoA dehydrogenase family protein [Oceanicella sp. SM1341]
MRPRLHFEPEHDMFRDSVRRFLTAEMAPQVARWRAQGHVDREAFLRMGAEGYLCMWAGEEHGGLGITDLRFDQVLQEETVRLTDPGFFHNAHSRLVGPYLERLATPAQKARFLPGAVRGETILGIALTEPDAGSDLAAIRTRADEQPDGSWRLDGAKTYISNGVIGDLFVVAARTGEARGRIGLFLVTSDMAGFSRGRHLKKIGLHAQDTAELRFDAVRVPAENLLGDPTRGFAYMAECLAVERLMSAITSIAHAQAAFELTCAFILERRAFGKPIAAFQNTRFRMAEMRAELDAAQSFVDRCVCLANESRLSAEAAAAAKLATSETEGRVIDQCVQFHGGAGYMEEYRIARMYADARISRVYAGASEIMLEIIGRGLGLGERDLT